MSDRADRIKSALLFWTKSKRQKKGSVTPFFCVWFQEKPLTKSLQRGEDPHFDQVSEEKCGQMFNIYSKLWRNLLWKIENWSCHCSHTMRCDIKRAEGRESLSRGLIKTFKIQWRTGAFTLSAGSGSVLGVSSRSAARHRRPCHSHRGVFVLLREAIQAAAQSGDSSPAPVLNEGSAVFPWPDSPPFLRAQPIPPIPSFSSLSPKTKTGPFSVSRVALGPECSLVSSPSFIAAPESLLECSYSIKCILQMQTGLKSNADSAAIRFWGLNWRSYKHRKHRWLSLPLVC